MQIRLNVFKVRLHIYGNLLKLKTMNLKKKLAENSENGNI